VKALAVDSLGQIIHRATAEKPPTHPQPGWVEADTERDLWGSVLRALRLLAEDGLDLRDIQVIGVTGMVPCLTALDAAGEPAGPTILYSDNRALEELDWVNRTAGLGLTAQAVVPKLIWLRAHQPEDFARIRTVFSAHNYVVYRLTGQRSIDYDTCSIMGGTFDDLAKDWRADVLERLDLDPGLFPDPQPATSMVGAVTSGAASQTGLPPGVPVMAGTGDTFATMLGCGVVDRGDGMVSFGTTGLLTLTQRPLVESISGPHFDDGRGTASVAWVANILSAGRLVRWYLDLFAPDASSTMGQDEAGLYAIAEAGASRLPPGADGLLVLPHWLGRRTPEPDPNLRGAIIGLTPSHTPFHIYRAILESFAYNQRQTFGPFRPQVRRLVATAGGSRSRLWRQIVADVLNFPLEYYPAASGALGIAFLAGYAAGLISDFDAVKRVWLSDPDITTPVASSVGAYDSFYDLYCEFERQMTVPFEHLARARGPNA
jgi:xylulokinase